MLHVSINPRTGETRRLTRFPGGILAARVYETHNWLDEMRGLIGETLKPDEALIIHGCRQVHTAVLRHPIDVAFCDDTQRHRPRVVHVETLPPWRVSRYVPGASLVIEMRAGSPMTSLRVGDLVSLFAPGEETG